MSTNGFDVNDADLRESFLRHEVPRAVERLDAASAPRWGKMRAQEMVEHLIWAFELSNGEARTDCSIPAGELPRMKRFLFNNRPTPQDVMNPALVAGLPALRYGAPADESSLSH